MNSVVAAGRLCVSLYVLMTTRSAAAKRHKPLQIYAVEKPGIRPTGLRLASVCWTVCLLNRAGFGKILAHDQYYQKTADKRASRRSCLAARDHKRSRGAGFTPDDPPILSARMGPTDRSSTDSWSRSDWSELSSSTDSLGGGRKHVLG